MDEQGSTPRVPCSDHIDVVKGMTEVTVILREVRDTISDVCHKFEQHTGLEGHPLMAQRVRNLEESHAKHTVILEHLVETTRTTGEAVTALAKAQETARTEKLAVMDVKTRIFVALLALSGTLGAAIVTLLKR